MKLGILIPEFPGQTHSFFWREITELRRHYHVETQIFSTRRPAQPVDHDWVAEAQATYLHPIPTAALPGTALAALAGTPGLLAHGPTRQVFGKTSSWPMLLYATRLQQLCRMRGIDHLHAHSCAGAALIAALCHRLGGPPYSLTLHGALRDYGGDQGYKWRGAAHVFTVSETLKNEVAEVLPDVAPRIRIAPMGVDTDRFRPAAGSPGSTGPFRWLVCARLNPGKGYDALLEAAAALSAGHDFSIRIAGEDEEGGQGYRKTLEAAIARRGLDDRITLLGALPQESVLAELQGADGFVLPSLHEALGVAYMEAMACELPVVGSRTGGVPELIEDGVSGLLVAPRDAGGLATAMVQVMEDTDLRQSLGTAARQVVVTRFGARRSADELARALGLAPASPG